MTKPCWTFPAPTDQSQWGAVAFVQRFNSALGLNVHFHVAAIDGVYAPGRDGRPEFFALRPPENAEVADLVLSVAERISAVVGRQSPEESDRLPHDEPWLAEVYATPSCRGVLQL